MRKLTVVVIIVNHHRCRLLLGNLVRSISFEDWANFLLIHVVEVNHDDRITVFSFNSLE